MTDLDNRMVMQPAYTPAERWQFEMAERYCPEYNESEINKLIEEMREWDDETD